ncbi:MAG: hypothetical protein FJ319_03920 [SAR202 cluster bacterium]|nr:hypothetical protein [SAR202 cluster bacterium]
MRIGVKPASTIATACAVSTFLLIAGGMYFLFKGDFVPVEGYWGIRGHPAWNGLWCIGLGYVMATRKPDNVLGWLFCTAAVLCGLQFLIEEYAFYSNLVAPGAMPFQELSAGVQGWVWLFLVGIVVNNLVLLFPTGSPLSRRWAVLLFVSPIAALITIVGVHFAPGPLENLSTIQNPYGVEDNPFLTGAFYLGFGLISATMLASAASTVVRFRRAKGIERQQMKWFTFAGFIVLVAVVAAVTIGATGADDADIPPIVPALTILAATGMYAATAMAILRYRLYDIDMVINRTMVYVPLTAILAGVYIAGIGVAKAVFSNLTGMTSDAAVAFATLVVTALFTPLRNSLQGMVDRRFKEPSEPDKMLNKYEKALQAVLHVHDRGAVTKRFMDEAVKAFGAQSAAVHLLNGTAMATACEFGTSHTPVLTVPKKANGAFVGSLTLGARANGGPYTQQNVASLERAAGTVGRALLLSGGVPASTQNQPVLTGHPEQASPT